MITARFANLASLAIIFPVAALMFSSNIWAASGNSQICSPNTSCIIGEFLYDDSYAPINNASCTITSRNPNGTLLFNNVSLTVSGQSDGWYSYSFTAPQIEGIYPSQVCCTAGGENLCLDKTFEVKVQTSLSQAQVANAVWSANKSSYNAAGTFGEVLQTAASSANDIASAVWGYSGRSLDTFGTLITDIWSSPSRSLTSFGTLVADIWSNTTRTLTGAGLNIGFLATKSDIDTVGGDLTGARTDITGIKNDLTTVKTDTATIKTDTSTIKTDLTTANANISIINTNTQNNDSDNSLLQADLNTLKSDTASLKTDLTTVKSNTTDVKSDVLALKTDNSTIKSNLDSVKSNTDSIKDDVSTVKDKTANLTNTTTVTNITNEVTNVQNITKEIQNITNESRILLEQIINRPTVENVLDSTITLDFQSKADNTKVVASQLFNRSRYLNGKVSLIDAKWGTLSDSEILSRVDELKGVLGSEVDTDSTSYFGMINVLENSWDWQITEQLQKEAKLVADKFTRLGNEVNTSGKTSRAKFEIASIKNSVDKMTELIGEKGSYKRNSVLGQLESISRLAGDINSKAVHIDNFLGKWNVQNEKEIKKEIDFLSKEVAQVNKLPKAKIALSSNKKDPQKYLKNQVLGLKGILIANLEMLTRKPNKAFINTWLEEGSIVFKTLATNPSPKINQEVKVKYYLPKEVKRENIKETAEGLSIQYDMEKDQYYVTGELNLAPGESRVLAVSVDDAVFAISEDEMGSLRKQADELSKPLNNTSFFAQGVSLKTDIDASLDKISTLQKDATTPEEKIRAYRGNVIELQSCKAKMEKLKELVTSAGSVGTLFGFVGGAQTLAVWGLIIIMATGFVFLALYMKTIAVTSNGSKSKLKRTVSDNESHEVKTGGKTKSMVIALIAGILVSFALGVAVSNIMARNNSNKSAKSENITNSIKKDATSAEDVLGADKQVAEEIQGEAVSLFVPENSSIDVYGLPNIDSPVLATFKASQTVEKLGTESNWVKVKLERNGQSVTGWVDADFIEKEVVEDSENKKQSDSGVLGEVMKLITVIDTPTGFLRVREGPWGKELTTIDPGQRFPLLDSKNGWVKIVLDDGNIGWVYEKYTDSKTDKNIHLANTGGY